MRIYHKSNYCRHCRFLVPKTITRCPKCGRLVRTKPRTSVQRHDKKYYNEHKQDILEYRRQYYSRTGV